MGRNMGQTESAINCLVLLMQRAAMKKCGLLDQQATTAPASVTTNPGFRVQQVNMSNDAALYLSKDVFSSISDTIPRVLTHIHTSFSRLVVLIHLELWRTEYMFCLQIVRSPVSTSLLPSSSFLYNPYVQVLWTT